MGALSNFTANLAIDHMLRTAVWAKPTHVWLALFTTAPGDAGGGVEVPVGGGYGRVDLPPLNANWTATQGGTAGASNGVTGSSSNAVTVTFGSPTVNWGTILAVGAFDANVAGNLAPFWCVLPTQFIINAGDLPPTFLPGSITFTLQRG